MSMKQIVPVITFLILMAACQSTTKGPEEPDTPISGTLRMAFEEGDSPSIKAQINLFSAIYRGSLVQPLYTNQNRIIELLLNDSIHVGVLHRRLSAEELSMFEGQRLTPRTSYLGRSALAVISAASYSDSTISIQALKNLFTAPLQKQYLVFDRTGSAAFMQIKDSICGGVNPGTAVVAAGSNPAVIQYVLDNPGAIGIIGASWLADMTDSTARSNFRKVRTLQVENLLDSKFYKPFYRHVALGKYPLSFGLYAVNTQHYPGLGTGFITFIAGAQGQLALKKSGIVPAKDQERVIQMHMGLPRELKSDNK
jgi:phosphate transport system substrate-binding protein